MTTPSGLPSWLRSNDFTAYGGHASKRNYQNIPNINPKTDVSAEALMRLAADVAAIQRTAAFCSMSISPRDGTSEDPLVNWVALPTGVYSSAPYEGGTPPAGYPTVTRRGTGVYRVQFSSSYTDPYGVAGSINLQLCFACPDSASGIILATVRNSATQFDISTFDVDGLSVYCSGLYLEFV